MMYLVEAIKFANTIVNSIRQFCDKIVVVGSIRRKRVEVRDVDLVLIPKTWLWNSIVLNLKINMHATVVKAGPKLVTLKLPTGTIGETMQVDIYRASPETWGVLKLIRTGSTEHNIKLCSRARNMGMMLSAKDGVIKDGKVIASKSETEIFKALNMEYVEPENREVEL